MFCNSILTKAPETPSIIPFSSRLFSSMIKKDESHREGDRPSVAGITGHGRVLHAELVVTNCRPSSIPEVTQIRPRVRILHLQYKYSRLSENRRIRLCATHLTKSVATFEKQKKTSKISLINDACKLCYHRGRTSHNGLRRRFRRIGTHSGRTAAGIWI